MFGLFKKIKATAPPELVKEGGYAYPHHSAAIHYHAGHPRNKREEARPGTGPYDGKHRFANSGVPKKPNGETYAKSAGRETCLTRSAQAARDRQRGAGH